MIDAKMQDALNAQINAEQYAAQLYLAMSAAMETKSFRGFAKWLRKQSTEETTHALKLVDFVLNRGGEVKLHALPAPPTEFGEPLQLFETVLKQEQATTAKINALFDLARSGKDYASEITLQWYIMEQVEEEETVNVIVTQLRTIADKEGSLWYLDKELGKAAKKEKD